MVGIIVSVIAFVIFPSGLVSLKNHKIHFYNRFSRLIFARNALSPLTPGSSSTSSFSHVRKGNPFPAVFGYRNNIPFHPRWKNKQYKFFQVV